MFVGLFQAYFLPKKMPWSLDPFIDPLITDIEDSFIHGTYIMYNYVVKGRQYYYVIVQCIFLRSYVIDQV